MKSYLETGLCAIWLLKGVGLRVEEQENEAYDMESGVARPRNSEWDVAHKHDSSELLSYYSLPVSAWHLPL